MQPKTVCLNKLTDDSGPHRRCGVTFMKQKCQQASHKRHTFQQTILGTAGPSSSFWTLTWSHQKSRSKQVCNLLFFWPNFELCIRTTKKNIRWLFTRRLPTLGAVRDWKIPDLFFWRKHRRFPSKAPPIICGERFQVFNGKHFPLKTRVIFREVL